MWSLDPLKNGRAHWTFGESSQHRKLQGEVFADPALKSPIPWILLLGGVHGDEIEGVWLLEEALRLWAPRFPYGSIGAVVWSQVNADGVFLKQRPNARGVDLNRNLPTKDWTAEVKNPRYQPGPSAASEPENQALVRLIDELKPRAILSVHSFVEYQVNANGPAREWADRLGKVCGYPVTEDIGYPTPGSLGTYAGSERQIPMITLEIERGISREAVLALHLPVLHEAMAYWEEQESRR